MTLAEFEIEFEALQAEGLEKEAVLLAQAEPKLYRRYWTEILGEELE